MKKSGALLTLALMSFYFWTKRHQTPEVEGALVKPLSQKNVIVLEKASPLIIPLKEAERFQLCAEDSIPQCSTQANDPKQIYFETAERIREVLKSSRGKSESERLLVASQALEIANDDVRAAALQLISDLKKQPLNLIFENCSDARSPRLINEMFEAFEKSESPEDLTRIHQFVQASILSGPLSSAPVYADKIGVLLDSNSIAQYQDILNQLPKNSARYLALETSLNEFAKR